MRRICTALLTAALALALAACGGPGEPGGAPHELQPIRIALDWTPNTNHTGLYVAQQRGWFREAGLDVQFLPYGSASPDTLVSSGAAEFGISFQDSFTFAKASGADTTSVLAVLQHWGSAIGCGATARTSRRRAISTGRRTAGSAAPAKGRRCGR